MPLDLPRPVAIVACLLMMTAPAAAEPRAELVLRGGAIYTMDAARSWASAVAIADGRILYVGDDAGVAAHTGRGTRVIELGGRMVLPGFHDSHMHPLSGGLRLVRCQLAGARSPEAIHAAVRACADASADREWLVGGGWEPSSFAAGHPHRATLDRLVPGRPVYLATEDGHTAWVSSRALAAAGIDASTPDPPGGRIERDPITGAPTGVLRGAAVSLIRRRIPPPTDAEYREGLRRSLAMANRFGITSVIDASADAAMLEQYRAADRAGALSVRVLASQRVDLGRGAEQVGELVARHRRVRGKRLRADAAKIFVDEDLHARGAALLEPYAGSPESRGMLRIAPEALDAIVTRLDAAGFQVHMHVLGDRAIRLGLDAIARAMEANGPRDRRHQLAHVALFDPADLPRLRRLGVVADVQPLWAQADELTRTAEDLLGPERARRLYPIASVMASGAVVVAGSDWPAPSMNPLDAIQIAMTRRPLDGSAPAWRPEERAGLAEMLAAYTIAGAWLAREDTINGSIEVGKAADLIVLERNLFEVEPMAVRHVRVLLTLLEGEPVYRAPDLAWP